jgi:predicted TIM-barrel fold metal-dependent hydrolase
LRVFDCHIHVQPWRQMHAAARELMTHGRSDVDRVNRALDDPGELLRILDEEGVERAALINYSAPEVMGFTAEACEWVAAYVRGHEDRLVAVGSVHPRETNGAAARAAYLFEALGIRMLKIHPPHQLFAANGYRDGDEALRQIYATAERCGRPVMINTGT